LNQLFNVVKSKTTIYDTNNQQMLAILTTSWDPTSSWWRR